MSLSSWVYWSDLSHAYTSSTGISSSHFQLFFPLFSLESSGLCSSADGQTMFLNTFGSGLSPFSSLTPANWSFSTSYSQRYATDINDGQFGIVNSVVGFSSWHIGAADHTVNDTDGYMMLIGLDGSLPPFYVQTFRQLCVGQLYEFTLYMGNVLQRLWNQTRPNIRLEVRNTANQSELIAQFDTGDIADYDSLTWTQYAISLMTPISSVDILLISQAPGGWGNDLVIDDIKFRSCSTNNLTICP